MTKCFEIRKLEQIEDNYEIFLIDLWGVVHNGINLFTNVLEVFSRLKQKNKKIVFITNAPRRSYVITEQLTQFGLSKTLYDFIASSGEITWNNMKKYHENKKCFLIGPPRDHHLVEDINLTIVDNLSSDVDIIVNTGPWGDDDCLENYKNILDELVKKRSLMICSNPDKRVIRGKKFMICAGLLAEYYEKIGGKVEYYGKPHDEIYKYCFDVLKKDKKILAIGDSLENDIKGANSQNIDSLLITDGIHREVNVNKNIDKQKLDDLIKKKKILPKFCMRELN